MTWNAEEHDPQWPYDITATHFALDRSSTALVVVDMQTESMCIADDSPMALRHPECARYYNDRLEKVVIPNLGRVIDNCRESGLRIAYTRNGSMTPGAAEMTPRLRTSLAKDSNATACHRGTPGYEIHSRLAPAEGDLVVDKLTSGSFTCTCLDHALRNMGIRGVMVTGILTDMCVLGTARAAAELGYDTAICEDACATLTHRAHIEALLMHARVFGRVSTTEELLSELLPARQG